MFLQLGGAFNERGKGLSGIRGLGRLGQWLNVFAEARTWSGGHLFLKHGQNPEASSIQEIWCLSQDAMDFEP